MQGMTEGLGEADVKQGDLIISMNGKSAHSLDSLFQTWEAITMGEAVTLELRRGDKTFKAGFAKPESKGTVIMKTH